jgi:hypothetical protein
VHRSDAEIWDSEHAACEDMEIMIHRAAAYVSGEPRDSTATSDNRGHPLSEGEHVTVVSHDKYDCVMSDGIRDHHVPMFLAEIKRSNGSHGYTEDVNLR